MDPPATRLWGLAFMVSLLWVRGPSLASTGTSACPSRPAWSCARYVRVCAYKPDCRCVYITCIYLFYPLTWACRGHQLGTSSHGLLCVCYSQDFLSGSSVGTERSPFQPLFSPLEPLLLFQSQVSLGQGPPRDGTVLFEGVWGNSRRRTDHSWVSQNSGSLVHFGSQCLC